MSSDRLSIFILNSVFSSVKCNSAALTEHGPGYCRDHCHYCVRVSTSNTRHQGKCRDISGDYSGKWSNGYRPSSLMFQKGFLLNTEMCFSFHCVAPGLLWLWVWPVAGDVNVGPFFGHNHRGLLWPVRSHAGLNRFIYWLSKEGEIKAFKYPPPLW